MIRLGVVGLSEGNGHPFSFSAILNGYSDEGFAQSGWPVIHNYIKKRTPNEFRSFEARVTHAWTQDAAITAKLCAASLIPHAVQRPEEMFDQVDAILLARDDYETHRELAEPILKRGIRVFIDKPLCATAEDLKFFMPYLESGQVVSFSSMRYAVELDSIKKSWNEFGDVKLIQGTILSSWEKYGIHLMDAAFGLDIAAPVSVAAQSGRASVVTISLENGAQVQLNTLGLPAPRCFRLSIYGSNKIEHVEILDNFGMFKRALGKFIGMLNGDDHRPDAIQTARSISLLIEAREKLALAGVRR